MSARRASSGASSRERKRSALAELGPVEMAGVLEELLLSWAPDFPLDHAGGVVDELAKAGIEPPPELIACAAPEWAASLAGGRRVHA